MFVLNQNFIDFFCTLGDVKSIEILIQNPMEDLKYLQEPWPLHETSARGFNFFTHETFLNPKFF